MAEYLIDCDADPSCNVGSQIVKHVKGGKIKWIPTEVRLYLSEEQKNGNMAKGNELCEELHKVGEPFNVNVLNHLLRHPSLIPEEWKGKHVYFWGTIYRDSYGHLGVRCLYWDGAKWDCSYRWIYGYWGVCSPAVMPRKYTQSLKCFGMGKSDEGESN